MKKSAKEIAGDMFRDGLRSRDCGAWDRLKKYDKITADKILENLYEIEIKHLMRQGA
jgi:hypothetical protein